MVRDGLPAARLVGASRALRAGGGGPAHRARRVRIGPLTRQFWPPAVAPVGASEITGNIGYALLALIIVWGFAAFGEKITYRGYLLTRTADLGSRRPGVGLRG